MRIPIVLLCLAGCHPYKETLNATQLGSARWIVSFKSNGATDSAHVLEVVNQRAAEVCGGDYDIEDSTGGVKSTAYTNRGTGMTQTAHSTDVAYTVRCR